MENFIYVKEKTDEKVTFNEYERLRLNKEIKTTSVRNLANGVVAICFTYLTEAEKKVKQQRLEIVRLQQQLASMDYKTSKYADGEYTAQEWQQIVAERQALRKQIRTLEQQLG